MPRVKIEYIETLNCPSGYHSDGNTTVESEDTYTINIDIPYEELYDEDGDINLDYIESKYLDYRENIYGCSAPEFCNCGINRRIISANIICPF